MHAPQKKNNCPRVLIGLTFNIHLLAREPINALVLSLHVFDLVPDRRGANPEYVAHEESEFTGFYFDQR